MSSGSYVVLECPECGEEFRRHQSNADGVRYCSKACLHGKSRQVPPEERVERDTDEWYTNRRKALSRDHYTCQSCGCDVADNDSPEVANAHVHHIEPISHGGTHSVDNLQTLCQSCHARHHSTGSGGRLSR